MKTRVSLRALNSFGLECVADEFERLPSEAAVRERFLEARRDGVNVTLLGGGTNVVCLARLPGRVFQVAMDSVRFERNAEGGTDVTAGAGVDWHELVRTTLQRGVFGLENLALIPGVVGAAPIQNIGAYGAELANVVKHVRVYDRERDQFVELEAQQCGFGYRDSIFKSSARDRYVVLAVTFDLGHSPLVTSYPDVAAELQADHGAGSVDANAVFDAVVRVRQRKLPDPRHVPNAGSFFKNPLLDAAALDALRSRVEVTAHPADGDGHRAYKVSAARLIDAAGWKGRQIGRVGVWQHQPLVLVNLGGATGRGVLDAASRIRDDVERRFGVRLVREPTVVGQDA